MLIAAGLTLGLGSGCDREPSNATPTPHAAPPASRQLAQTPAALPDPSPDDFRIDAARRLMADGRLDLAETALRTVLAEKPASDRARFFLAVSVAKQKRYGEARPLYEEIARSGRTFPERRHVPHFHGWALFYLGEHDLAREQFLLHAESVPEEGDSAFALGVIALEKDDQVEAERWLLEAIRRQEGSPALVREIAKAEARLGDLRYRQDRVEEAVVLWQRCVDRWPDHHEAWSKLARGQARLGRETESAYATTQWRNALARLGREVPPDSPGASP